MTCGETTGFLVHHDCGREAAAHCHLCGKAVCAMHTRTAEAQIYCITCLKRWLEGRPAEERQQILQQQAQQQAQQAQQQPYPQRPYYYGSPWYYYDDPYWYTDYHYSHYHHHYHDYDFTPADRAAFEPAAQPAPAAGQETFETDKLAS